MDTVPSTNVPTSVVPDEKHTQDNIYHITTTYQARTIFDRAQHSAYQYLERRAVSTHQQRNEDFSRFKDENARLQSFNHQWPTDCPLDKNELAKAGLFFTGPGDRVQCPWCEGGLYNWVEGDTAFGEHAKYFPSCPFVVSSVVSRHAPTVNSSTNRPVVSSSTTTMVETTSNSAAVNQDWTRLPCVVAITALGYSLDDIESVVNKLKIKGVSGERLILLSMYLNMISVNDLILQDRT